MTLSRRSFCVGLGLATAHSNQWVNAMSKQPGERPHRIRHYVLATEDLNATCNEIYEFLDLAPTPLKDGPSPTAQFGFETNMMRIGDTLIEVVQPIQSKHRLHDWMRANGGPGGYMVVLQTFSAQALKRRAADEALRLTRDMEFRGQHMIQFDIAHFGTHFELYEYTPEENWWGNPMGRNYPISKAVSEITGCEIAVNEPQEIAAQIAKLFIGRLESNRVHFYDKVIRFTQADQNRQGLAALEFKTLDPKRAGEARSISGLEFRLSSSSGVPNEE